MLVQLLSHMPKLLNPSTWLIISQLRNHHHKSHVLQLEKPAYSNKRPSITKKTKNETKQWGGGLSRRQGQEYAWDFWTSLELETEALRETKSLPFSYFFFLKSTSRLDLSVFLVLCHIMSKFILAPREHCLCKMETSDYHCCSVN